MTRPYRMLTTREQQDIARRYPAESSTTLAKEYGCTPPTIRAAVRRAGGTIPQPHTHQRQEAP